MKQNYRLRLAPSDGPTLERRTQEEWSLGYTFKVLSSDLLSMRRGSYITIDDIRTAEEYNDLSFKIKFDTFTPFDKLRDESGVEKHDGPCDDINAQYILDNMVQSADDSTDGLEHFILSIGR
tara:strand:+ start:1086 stop:1451 length:366 start_codon:yes stop_codon:yes gene_type:complete